MEYSTGFFSDLRQRIKIETDFLNMIVFCSQKCILLAPSVETLEMLLDGTVIMTPLSWFQVTLPPDA